MNSSVSFAPLVVTSLRGLGLMLVRSGVGLAYKLAVVSGGRKMIVFDLRKVVDVVVDYYMMEDRVDRCCS